MKNYDCYKYCDPKLQKELTKYLRTIYRRKPEHRQKIRNLYEEHFLLNYKMLEIFAIFQASIAEDFESKLPKLISHAYDSLCSGDYSKIPEKIIFAGSVIPKISFFNYLKKDYLYLFKKENEIYTFIDSLCLDTSSVNPKYKSIPLRPVKRIIWMTWDNVSISQNPFFFMQSSYAEEARVALGLGYPSYVGEELLAFNFASPTEWLFRPTICDSGYNDYFRPTSIDFNDYGIIRPLTDGLFTINKKNWRLSDSGFNLPESVNWGSEYMVKDLLKCSLLIST
jgi:hypothetical protein